MLPFIIFGGGVALLLIGADLLVRSASRIAKVLGISEFVIGVTVVAFGTSIPEVGTSVYSALIGHPGIAYGNVIGSNVANIALVLGIAALFGTFKIKKEDVSDIPIFLLAMVLTVLVAADLRIHILEGLVLLGVYELYLMSIVRSNEKKIRSKAHNIDAKSLVFLVLSLYFIYYGARFAIEGALGISAIFGISESIIGFTLVALSTSLPELATSVIAVFKKEFGISIGNIIGSNIFNSLVVLGLSSIVTTLTLTLTDLMFQVPAMVLLSIYLAYRAKNLKLTKLDGLIFLAAYTLIMLNLF